MTLTMRLDSFGGAWASEVLAFLIDAVKNVNSFETLFGNLTSTMELLIPTIKKIESIQDMLPFETADLKELEDTMVKTDKIVKKCQEGVTMFNKGNLTTEIKGINEDLLKFIQITLPFVLLKKQLTLHRESLGLQEKINDLRENINDFQEKLNDLQKKLNDLIDGMVKKRDDTQPCFVDLCSVPKLNMVPVGLDMPLMELKRKLFSVDRLVVSAPPGCGKTTLVTQLCHDEDIKNEFKNIFFTVVSSTPSFRVIVRKLIQHNGFEARAIENDSEAVVALEKLMEKLKENSKKTLLVLDDVWQGAGNFLLWEFLIGSPDLKILVTSRFELRGVGSTYKLKPLKDEDAKNLLIQWAPRPDDASLAEYEDLLQKILKRCNGLPILIEVFGVSLRGRSLNSWKSRVESWSEGEAILNDDTLLGCLQRSFDALTPDLKECFLDMGSFLVDQKICASIIIDIWVELYGKSSSLCKSYLDDHASQNLLKLDFQGIIEHEDGFYNEFFVTQNDIWRELAIRQSKSEASFERKRLNLEIREDIFPDWCSYPRHPTIIYASLLSISTDEFFSSSWVEMDCPNVVALVLNLSSTDYALPSFIAGMKKLKVLTVQNHGLATATLSNISCLSSLPNLKRIRLERVIISSLDIPQLQLGRLKKLSLVMCSFREVGTEDVVISKALPSLQEIDIDYCYDLDELPYWIYEVVSLKTLSITNCDRLSKLPEAIGNMSNLEILRLYSCIFSELPETIERLRKLRVLDISDCIELTKLPKGIGKLQNLKKISMVNCSSCELPDSVRNLENLEVKCDKRTAFFWERFKPKMTSLRIHEVEEDDSLYLFSDED